MDLLYSAPSEFSDSMSSSVDIYGSFSDASSTVRGSIQTPAKHAAAVLVQNENYLLEVQKILRFISTGLRRLQDHPALVVRRGFVDPVQMETGLKMLQFMKAPAARAQAVCTRAVGAARVQARKLKKSYIALIVAEIKSSADILHGCVHELVNIKNQLQDAMERCGLIMEV
uniref:Uncharacterized protein n=1 Tax=Knipowitschia caucasica TaxID=637954 RepID=A0AAV2KQ27_KNICA